MNSEVAIPESEELQLPHSGELVSLQDATACVLALQEVRSIEARLRETKQLLSAAIVAESQRQGTKTLYIDGVAKVEIRSKVTTVWDASELEAGLRAAGLPEDRIREVVKEEVSYTVVAREAKRVAGANEAYAAIVERSQSTVEGIPYVSVSKA